MGRTEPEHGRGYRVARMRRRHIDAVARLHATGFDGFLASLGAPVLRHFYRTFLDYRAACALVAVRDRDGAVVGFVAGTEDVSRHYRVFLLRRALPMAPALMRRALSSRAVTTGLLRRARQLAGIAGRRGGSDAADRPAVPPAHLMMTVVDPSERGRGAGELLVRAFVDHMRRRGVPRLVLGVRDDNHAARRLYERLGWRPAVLLRAHDGSDSWLYTRDLAADMAAPPGEGTVGDVALPAGAA